MTSALQLLSKGDVLRWELLGRSVNVCSMEFVCIEEVFCVLTCA